MHFSVTSHKKQVTFAGFRQNNYGYAQPNLNKNCTLKIVSREKNVNIAEVITYIPNQLQKEA